MTDRRFSRRDWLQTVPVATLGLTGSLGPGSAVAVGKESEGITQDASGPYEQQQKLIASDGNPKDDFGVSVALSEDGTTALIGAQKDNNQNGENAGAAYVFEQSGGSWTQQQKLTADDGDDDDGFGISIALSEDGTTALVNALFDEDPNGEDAGSVYVFEQSGGSWTQQQKLTADDGDDGDFFGIQMSLSEDGTTALIGASRDDNPNGNDAGSAYIFEQSGGSWSQQQKLTADGDDGDDEFGRGNDLSVDGTTAIIGARFEDNENGEDAGAAYVFEQSGGSWTQQQKLTADDGGDGDRFGDGIALSEDGTTALIVAERTDDPNGNDTGSAYVFERIGGSWSQQQKLSAEDGDEGDQLSKVALTEDGTTALIGASRDDNPNGNDAGSAYIFEQSGGSWSQQQKLTANDGDQEDRFGFPTALNGDGTTALIGASDDQNTNGDAAGSAYVFSSDANSGNAPPTAEAGPDQTVSGGETVTLNASGSSDPDGDTLSYSWAQTAGSDVSLSDGGTATPEFTAPDVESETDLVFEVTVDDGSASDTDTTTVTVQPTDDEGPPPVSGEEPPTDPDGDGVYEDLDGDGETTLADVRLYYSELYQNPNSEYVQDNLEFFDIDGDGEITLADVQALFEERND